MGEDPKKTRTWEELDGDKLGEPSKKKRREESQTGSPQRTESREGA